MKHLPLLLLTLLYGCSMSNDDVIKETKKCEGAGSMVGGDLTAHKKFI